MLREIIQLNTRGRGFVRIDDAVHRALAGTSASGLCHLFLQHTSASLLLTENADPTVLADLERWMQLRVPDGAPEFRHTQEGPDDMPAHVRSVLAGYELTVPVDAGRLMLGTWQGIFLWEHRLQPQQRSVVLTLTTG